MANRPAATQTAPHAPDPLTVNLPPDLAEQPAADLLGTPKTWRDDAQCLGTDPAIFFPETTKKGQGDNLGGTREARRVCGRCRVRVDCLVDTMERGHTVDVGVWGGTSPKDRKKLAHAGWTAEKIRAYAADNGGRTPPIPLR